MRKITIEDIESITNFKISNECKQMINDFNLEYQQLNQQERDNIIFKILFELHNKGFSTNISIPKVKLLLSKLSEKKNEWKPFTAELIPFETLFKAKYKGY